RPPPDPPHRPRRHAWPTLSPPPCTPRVPFLFFNAPAPPEIYPLSLHDALPISRQFLTESLVDGERSQSKSFSSCARIGRIFAIKIGRAVQQECRDRSRMPSSA